MSSNSLSGPRLRSDMPAIAAPDAPPGRRPGDAPAGNAPLILRCVLLPPDQRRIMELLLSGEYSLRALSRMAGVNAGTMCRRVQAIKARLASPIVGELAHRGNELPEPVRQAAVLHFVHGLTLRALCERLQMTRESALRAIEFVHGWAQRPQRMVG